MKVVGQKLLVETDELVSAVKHYCPITGKYEIVWNHQIVRYDTRQERDSDWDQVASTLEREINPIARSVRTASATAPQTQDRGDSLQKG